MLPDECDFCGQVLDEDEELIPVFVGSPPTPKPIHLQGFSEHPHSRYSQHGGDLSDVRLRGNTLGEYLALVDALESSDFVEFKMSAMVREVRAVGGASHSLEIEADAPTRLDTRLDDKKAGASVRVEAKFDEPEPDLRVCEFCEGNFKNEDESH